MNCMTIITATECINNEMLTNTWQETEHFHVCCAINGAHMKLCEAQCLEMYQPLQYTLWL